MPALRSFVLVDGYVIPSVEFDTEVGDQAFAWWTQESMAIRTNCADQVRIVSGTTSITGGPFELLCH